MSCFFATITATTFQGHTIALADMVSHLTKTDTPVEVNFAKKFNEVKNWVNLCVMVYLPRILCLN